jgi:hypothetical protein
LIKRRLLTKKGMALNGFIRRLIRLIIKLNGKNSKGFSRRKTLRLILGGFVELKII